jgi:thioredoxin-like negative regulator of GroEL
VDDHAPADRALWAKAAEGLRNNDFNETQSALATLEHAGSAADREAARLIRAQLMLHQGNTSGARALLQDLADHAQSEAVRAKARNLLAAPSNSALNTVPSGT